MNEAAIRAVQLWKVYEGNVKTEALKGVDIIIEKEHERSVFKWLILKNKFRKF